MFKTSLAILFLLLSGAALAQTDDGETPAEETVCDALKEPGITKGLYGLCVAFCEAGDYADELDTITPEELATLETSSPSGRILANYNKKKQDTDPDMPCVLVEEPCPCWTADELADVADGLHNFSGDSAQQVVCYESVDYVNTADFSSHARQRQIDQVLVWNHSNFKACQYYMRDIGIPYVFSRLSIQAGTLTETQHGACLAQIQAHYDSRTACTVGNHP